MRKSGLTIFKSPALGGIDVDGETAQAHYDRSVTTLRKVDGRWLID